MKEIVIDFLVGLPVMIAITACEFLVTLPFGHPGEIGAGRYSQFVNSAFLLTSIPTFFITYFFARLLKTREKSSAIKRGAIWTAIAALHFFMIGIGNANLGVIFGGIGVYVLLGCSFAGPVLYAKTQHFDC